jgi:alkanesulfonate monooxygenase SsuD/methylene tetrahydromethanopterin reductase-like flavin-dependent oxidoreductase (luciferase family)
MWDASGISAAFVALSRALTRRLDPHRRVMTASSRDGADLARLDGSGYLFTGAFPRSATLRRLRHGAARAGTDARCGSPP